MTESTPSAEAFENLLEQATDGDRGAAHSLLRHTKTFRFFVPDRHQSQPLSDAPEYPNDFFSLLGIQAEEHVVIPIFTRVEHIKEWCGSELQYTELVGAKLFERVPTDWWITLNPGSEVGKDFSYWEIDLLRGGEEQLAVILDELFPADVVKTLDVAPLDEEDRSKLAFCLSEQANELSEVQAIYLLKQDAQDSVGDDLSLILVGVEFSDNCSQEAVDRAKDTLERAAREALIGSHPVRLYTGTQRSKDFSLGIFRNQPPVFQREGYEGFLTKLLKPLRSQS